MITKIDEPKFNMFIYGTSGHGKTTLASTALNDPRMTPVLWIDLSGNPQVFDMTNPNVSIITLTEPKDFVQLESILVKNGEIAGRKASEFKCIVFDTLTQLNRLVLTHSLNTDENFGKLTSDGEKRMMQAYNASLNFLTHFTFVLTTKLRQHSIVLVQEKHSEWSPDKMPNLTGQAIGEVSGYYNVLGRIVKASSIPKQELEAIRVLTKEKRSLDELITCIQFKPGQGVPLAKVQHYGNTMPPFMFNPTISEILNFIPFFNSK